MDASESSPFVLFPAAALLVALVYAFCWRISGGDRQLQLCAAFACAWVNFRAL